MLVAVEENSGRLMKLETIEWGQKVQIQVDTKMPLNSRLKLKEYKTWCTHNESKKEAFLLRLTFKIAVKSCVLLWVNI